jgi:hypothetical protein
MTSGDTTIRSRHVVPAGRSKVMLNRWVELETTEQLEFVQSVATVVPALKKFESANVHWQAPRKVSW